MKKLKNKILVFVPVLMILFQTGSEAQDTLKLSRDEFLSIVRTFHPVLRKYHLQNTIAQAGIDRAKGNFDPQIGAKLGEKNVDATRYYEQQNAGIDIPTWYGVDFNAGYNQYQGEKLNNSDTKGELYHFGVTIPLAKNLWYDKRRAALDQARITSEMTAAEQILMTNQLLLEAENVYWEWVRAYQVYALQQNAVKVNEERLDMTRRSLLHGERPAVDTVEVQSQLQGFLLQSQEALLQFVKNTLELQWFLWNDKEDFYEIDRPLVPVDRLETEQMDTYAFLIQESDSLALSAHQALRYYLYKNDFLSSERKLKWQSLLPKLDFTYQFYSRPGFRTAEFITPFERNFQYGLKFEMPLFLREARADYKIAGLKLEQNRQDRLAKERELVTKMDSYRNEILIVRQQISIATQNLVNYQKLLTAEETRYQNGESSLFMVNSRENKLIEAREKLYQLHSKFIAACNKLKWLRASMT